jgi:hypothetical protein
VAANSPPSALDGSVPEVLLFSGGAAFSGAELVLIFLSSLAIIFQHRVRRAEFGHQAGERGNVARHLHGLRSRLLRSRDLQARTSRQSVSLQLVRLEHYHGLVNGFAVEAMLVISDHIQGSEFHARGH